MDRASDFESAGWGFESLRVRFFLKHIHQHYLQGERMIQKRTFLLLATAALILASLACSFSASTANIKDAFLSADPDGKQPTDVFTPEQTFYLIVDQANAPDDTVLKATWSAVEVEGVESGLVIDEVEITTGLPEVTFDLANNNLWPTGSYQVELFLNGEMDRSLDFEVR
jgi:hypothetical protein